MKLITIFLALFASLAIAPPSAFSEKRGICVSSFAH
jgi:hypothetical protein